MYRIINVVDGMEYILHDQRDSNLTVLEPRLVLTLNKTGTLEFKVPEDHRYYETLRKLKSSIRLLEDGILIYEGRIIIDESDFYNMRSITCEGSLAYFLDSVQRPFLLSGKSPREVLEFMVESHNMQVEERKRFTIGLVTVTDENNRADRENKTIKNTFSIVNTHLLDVFGGYLWVSYQDEKKVLNYTWDYGGFNEQEIRFGMNLLDLTKYQDATNLFTRVIPTGADMEYKNELGEKQTKTIDITAVNNGKDYMDADPSAIEEYGIITTTLNWPNIVEPEKLKKKAEAYLKESIQIPETLKISAVDLNYAGADISRFKLGRHTKVVSRQHHLEKELLLSKLDLYLDDPKKGSISLGGTQPSLTSSMANQEVDLSKAIDKIGESASEEINRKVENATQLITGGFGGYVVIDNIDPNTGKKMHPWRILVMNTPDKDTAKNVIQINQNGLGFSTTGINGPYRNAWTIDGNLVADFVTTGTMLADRIRGGTLELGGPGIGRDGKIVVKDVGGKDIGYWDKTGLHVMQGVIEGTTIKGSDIVGGTINIGNGTFMVDRSGEVEINSGEINIGNVLISEGYTWLGDFGISSTGEGVFYSRDSGNSVEIHSASSTLESGPMINLKKNNKYTKISSIGIETDKIICGEIYPSGSWWGGWSLTEEIRLLHDAVFNK